MSRTIYYRQCQLVKKEEVGTRHQTSYLPERFAIQGKVLRLRNAEGTWEDGWVVEQASEARVSEDLLPDSHQEIKWHRRATGDAMPRERPE